MSSATFSLPCMELPREWAERLKGVRPDQKVRVTIESEPETLDEKLDRAIKQAENGETVGPFDTHEELLTYLHQLENED